MKPEIKSENDFVYHYDREERLKKISVASSLRKPKEGFFKKNRSVIFIFINMILIYLVFGLIYPKIENPKFSSKIIGNYSFSIEGLESDENISIIFTSKKIFDRKKSSKFETEVQIYYANENSLNFIIPLPEKINEKSVIHNQIKRIPAFTEIKARIIYNKKIFNLIINMKTK